MDWQNKPSSYRYRQDRVKRLYGVNCYLCGVVTDRETFTIDHMLPRSRGGKKTAENERPCCRQCNAIKGEWTVEELRLLLEARNGAPHLFHFELRCTPMTSLKKQAKAVGLKPAHQTEPSND